MAVTESMYLDNLDEFVNDENRVVTYKWLSRTLAVHVNQAKQMLYTFVQKQRNDHENDKLNVTYLVTGSIKTENGNKLHVSIVPEENLEVCQTQYQVVNSCHVYSVQQAKLKDTNPLYMADYELMKKDLSHVNAFSAITCKAAVPHSQDQLHSLRTVAQPTNKALSFTKQEKQNGTTKSSSKAPSGIQGMFAKAEKKKQESPSLPADAAVKPASNSNTAPTKPEGKQNTTKPKPGGVAAFFSKQSNKPKKTPAEKPKEEEKPAVKPTEEEKPKPAETKKQPKFISKGKKKAADPDGESGQKSKRRRIVQMSDSSDEEEDMDVLPDTPPASPPREPTPPPREPTPPPREPSPEPETTHISTSSDGQKKRKRKKKWVNKTFCDEDGFMVTEKVQEDESCTDVSEDEVKPPPQKTTAGAKEQTKPQAKKKSPQKKTPPKAGRKQMSLTSFFTKK